ncbi:MAG: hypothetical protein LBS86_04555, partial [Treponema sp.]|nr:hypothetical protein [Treponema sp.]
MKDYGEVHSDYPERIFKMAEAHSAANIRRKDRMSLAPLVGQVFSFLLGCIGFGLCAYLASKGLESGAIVSAIGGIA